MGNVATMGPHYARLWIKENPEPWRRMVSLALAESRAERRFSVAWLAEEVRKKDYTNIEGKPFKLNNSIKPALARILIKEHPEVAPYIETRRSMSDGLV